MKEEEYAVEMWYPWERWHRGSSDDTMQQACLGAGWQKLGCYMPAHRSAHAMHWQEQSGRGGPMQMTAAECRPCSCRRGVETGVVLGMQLTAGKVRRALQGASAVS